MPILCVCYSCFGFQKYSSLQSDWLNSGGSKNIFHLYEPSPILLIIRIWLFWSNMEAYPRNVTNVYSSFLLLTIFLSCFFQLRWFFINISEILRLLVKVTLRIVLRYQPHEKNMVKLWTRQKWWLAHLHRVLQGEGRSRYHPENLWIFCPMVLISKTVIQNQSCP